MNINHLWIEGLTKELLLHGFGWPYIGVCIHTRALSLALFTQHGFTPSCYVKVLVREWLIVGDHKLNAGSIIEIRSVRLLNWCLILKPILRALTVLKGIYHFVV